MIRTTIKKETVNMSDKHYRNSVNKACQNMVIMYKLEGLNKSNFEL